MKIAEKKKVLNGRGVVLSYENGNSAGEYFYKERIEGTKRYGQKKVEGATNLIQAEEMAMEIAPEMKEWDKENGYKDICYSLTQVE